MALKTPNLMSRLESCRTKLLASRRPDHRLSELCDAARGSLLGAEAGKTRSRGQRPHVAADL